MPKKIITDRGAAFRSTLMKDVAKRYAIKLSPSSGYHPQTNGKIERMHRDLGIYMRLYLENNKDWENILPNFVLAHNTAEKDRDRYSPAYLVYGQELRHPADSIDNNILWTHQEDTIGEMLQTLRAAMQIITTTRNKIRARLEESYNENRRHVEMKVGDSVYAYENALSKIKGKFIPHWTGPWEIKG